MWEKIQCQLCKWSLYIIIEIRKCGLRSDLVEKNLVLIFFTIALMIISYYSVTFLPRHIPVSPNFDHSLKYQFCVIIRNADLKANSTSDRLKPGARPNIINPPRSTARLLLGRDTIGSTQYRWTYKQRSTPNQVHTLTCLMLRSG
jgi:hypothetical protein